MQCLSWRLLYVLISAMTFHLSYDAHLFSDYVLRRFQMWFLEAGKSLHFYRKLHQSYAAVPSALIEALGALPGWTVFQANEFRVMALCPQGCLRFTFLQRAGNTDCSCECWAINPEAGAAMIAAVKSAAGFTFTDGASMAVDWFFSDGRSIECATVHERFADQLLPAAYPWLQGGLHTFTEQYLYSTAPILIFYGPPGTGKTRLIRHILKAMSTQRNEPLRVAYTADVQSSGSDEFFVRFMTRGYDAMVIEDADHLLAPRAHGNQGLHRFLAVSDGLLNPEGRRLIFSTNLPSKLEIDEALVRPGRCFACVGASKLDQSQANTVVHALTENAAVRQSAQARLRATGVSAHALAEIYAAVEQSTLNELEHGSQLSPLAGHPEADSTGQVRVH
jgi:hypothetical protein